jgi:hypothetical protein
MRLSTPSRVAIALGVAVAAILVVIALSERGQEAITHGHPVAMLEEDVQLRSHPAQTLALLRSIGVGIVRLSVPWDSIAPSATSQAPPRGFDGTNPAAYPQASWRPYDTIVRDARREGIELDLLLTGGAPLWATGRGRPRGQGPPGAWQPSASMYGQFVQAVATRYSGDYLPSGGALALPRVHVWEIWNEPNWGPSLQPQMALDPLRIVSAPSYRSLLDAAWRGLARSGHGSDTVIIGSLSPRGVAAPPDTALQAAVDVSSPLGFTRTLYCVDSTNRPLRGTAALRAGCPPTAAGSRTFRRLHPALFQASGFGIHPYPINLPPTEADASNSGTVEFSQIPQLADALDRLQHLYGSTRQLSIYNTEFGYITNPPNPGTQYLSPPIAAHYLNWAEYLTWRNPRIATTMQYLLFDPNPKPTAFGPGGFATGLILYDGKPKPTFFAYRMPIFLPVTSAAHGDRLELWGCVRPAHYAYLDTHQAQHAEIQFRPASGGTFRTLKTVQLDAARGCYFDVRPAFEASGTVRLKWSYPSGDRRLRDPLFPSQATIYSRDVAISLH